MENTARMEENLNSVFYSTLGMCEISSRDLQVSLVVACFYASMLYHLASLDCFYKLEI